MSGCWLTYRLTMGSIKLSVLEFVAIFMIMAFDLNSIRKDGCLQEFFAVTNELSFPLLMHYCIE